MATAWQRHGNRVAIVWQLLGDNMTTAWQQRGYCMATRGNRMAIPLEIPMPPSSVVESNNFTNSAFTDAGHTTPTSGLGK